MTRSTHRLIVGLVFSVAAHGLLLAGVRPMMTAADPTSTPLRVELLDSPPKPDASAVATAQSEWHTPPDSAPAAAAPTRVERQQPIKGPETVAGPDLRFTPDQYYTSRELDVRAEPVNEIPLVYPQLAYQNRTKGKVLLRILINERGNVDEVTVLEAEPRGIFEDAALAATQPLRFSPAIRAGRPVRSQKVVEVVFDPYETIHLP